ALAPATRPSCQDLPSSEYRNSGLGVGLVVSLPTTTTALPSAATSFSFWSVPRAAAGTVNSSSPDRPVPVASRSCGSSAPRHDHTTTPAATRSAMASEMAIGTTGLRRARIGRSEEHTSELQSREKLVCRLLLEKK